jgi:hypothetical protein
MKPPAEPSPTASVTVTAVSACVLASYLLYLLLDQRHKTDGRIWPRFQHALFWRSACKSINATLATDFTENFNQVNGRNKDDGTNDSKDVKSGRNGGKKDMDSNKGDSKLVEQSTQFDHLGELKHDQQYVFATFPHGAYTLSHVITMTDCCGFMSKVRYRPMVGCCWCC